MNEKIRELLELRRLMDELKGEIAAVQGEIMAEMDMAGTDEVSTEGVTVRYKLVKTARLDTAALKKALPDVAASFTRESCTKRFTVTA